jgi:SAM-dependent methyltransferase
LLVIWSHREPKIFRQDRVVLESSQPWYDRDGGSFERSVEADVSTLLARRIVELATRRRVGDGAGRAAEPASGSCARIGEFRHAGRRRSTRWEGVISSRGMLLDRRSALKLLLAAFGSAMGGSSFAADAAASNFKAVYGDAELRKRFYLFLKNVFHLYPEDRFQRLIQEVTTRYDTDADIYRALATRLPEIKPRLAAITYAMPALAKQKEEMARETAELLGPLSSVKGYVEIGTPGRYVKALRRRIPIDGAVFVANDYAPGLSLADIAERGGVRQAGDYLPLGNYDAFDAKRIPDASIDLITNYIGFHHAPTDRLHTFVDSIRRILAPKGRLIVRDHDVTDADMDALVALAHDVFNAGVGLSWEENHAQIRHFRSVKALDEYLATRGFVRSGGERLQAGDPTKNTLLMFVKQA